MSFGHRPRLSGTGSPLRVEGVDEADELLAGVHAALLVHVVHVRFRGALGDAELLGDVADVAALCQQEEHIGLAARQQVGVGNVLAAAHEATLAHLVGLSDGACGRQRRRLGIRRAAMALGDGVVVALSRALGSRLPGPGLPCGLGAASLRTLDLLVGAATAS